MTCDTKGRACVGWGTILYTGDSHNAQGVGDDANSWGFDGYSREKRHSGISESWGYEWSAGDVIGCAVDVDNRLIAFSINGEWSSPLGVAFHNFRVKGGLVPCVSFDSSFRFQINFGQQKFRFLLSNLFLECTLMLDIFFFFVPLSIKIFDRFFLLLFKKS